MYAATIGTFLQRDPLGQIGGGVLEHSHDAVSRLMRLIKGVYAGAEYLDGPNLMAAYFVPNRTDPFGLDVWSESTNAILGLHHRVCADSYDAACNKVGQFCISFGAANHQGGFCSNNNSSSNSSSNNSNASSDSSSSASGSSSSESSNSSSSGSTNANRDPGFGGGVTRLPGGGVYSEAGNGIVSTDNKAAAGSEITRVPMNCRDSREAEAHLRRLVNTPGVYSVVGYNCREFAKSTVSECKRFDGP